MNAANSYTEGGEINKEEGYILLSLIFSDTRVPKNDLWATTIHTVKVYLLATILFTLETNLFGIIKFWSI